MNQGALCDALKNREMAVAELDDLVRLMNHYLFKLDLFDLHIFCSTTSAHWECDNAGEGSNADDDSEECK